MGNFYPNILPEYAVLCFGLRFGYRKNDDDYLQKKNLIHERIEK